MVPAKGAVRTPWSSPQSLWIFFQNYLSKGACRDGQVFLWQTPHLESPPPLGTGSVPHPKSMTVRTGRPPGSTKSGPSRDSVRTERLDDWIHWLGGDHDVGPGCSVGGYHEPRLRSRSTSTAPASIPPDGGAICMPGGFGFTRMPIPTHCSRSGGPPAPDLRQFRVTFRRRSRSRTRLLQAAGRF